MRHRKRPFVPLDVITQQQLVELLQATLRANRPCPTLFEAERRLKVLGLAAANILPHLGEARYIAYEGRDDGD